MVMVITMAMSCLSIAAKPLSDSTSLDSEIVKKDSEKDLTISLITCYPGQEIYELCGHSAIRVRGENIDSVWNFGIFDFNQPNFIYRFVKGETDYRCASYPFKWFMPEYVERGSKVVEQDLNLTSNEAKSMLNLLRENTIPPKNVYRYNYVKDNCATRILDKITESVSMQIIYPDSLRYGTFRNEMRAYHKDYPWYQFGIDLALGSGLDYNISPKEEMFVPIEMMRNLSSAKFSDGRQVVKETRILNKGVENASLPPTPWYFGPLFWSWIVALITFCAIYIDLRKQRLSRFFYYVWFISLGLAGCLITFLVFISVHEATNPNVLILWLNPLQFLFALGIAVRKLRPIAIGMAYYNIIVVGVLLIVSPFITQSFNCAFYPLMIATISLGLNYAIIGNKSSYKISKKDKNRKRRKKA